MICQLSSQMKCFTLALIISFLTKAIVVKLEPVIVICSSTGVDDNTTEPCSCPDFANSKNVFSEADVRDRLSAFSKLLPQLKLYLGNVSRLILNVIVPREKIQKGLLTLLKHIVYLDISGNNITTIKNDTFKDMENLKTLILSNNNISSLPLGVFIHNAKLMQLDLSYNFLTIISAELFRKLKNLQKLHLRSNQIQRFDRNIFQNSLDFVDLSCNKISFNYELPCTLKENVSKDDSSAFIQAALVSAKGTVTVNLTTNNISGLSLARINCEYLSPDISVRILLKDNPIQCDCKAYDLIQYFQNESDVLPLIKKCINIDSDISCATPDTRESIRLSFVNTWNISCNASVCKKCPNNCICEFYIKIKKLDVRCVNAELTSIPMSLGSLDDHCGLRMLSFHHNSIEDVDLIGAYNLQGLQVLELNNNELKVFSDSLPSRIEALNLTRITLGNNPWNCSDCRNKNFVDFLNRADNVKDVDEVKCSDSNNLVKFSKIPPCNESPNSLFVASVTTLTLTAIVCITILIGIYVRYKFKPKRLIPLPRDINMSPKTAYYDAFISYSHEDEEYVAELVQKLENRPNPYKICLHSRNWKPGEFIVKQMAQSIKHSRTTLVILSASYSKSEWCNAEFHLALTEMILYKNHKIIVIWYEHEDPKYFNLEPILENYVHMCTYLKRDDGQFMDKLEAAIENE